MRPVASFVLQCKYRKVLYCIALNRITFALMGGKDLVWRPNALSPPRLISSFTQWAKPTLQFHPVGEKPTLQPNSCCPFLLPLF